MFQFWCWGCWGKWFSLVPGVFRFLHRLHVNLKHLTAISISFLWNYFYLGESLFKFVCEEPWEKQFISVSVSVWNKLNLYGPTISCKIFCMVSIWYWNSSFIWKRHVNVFHMTLPYMTYWPYLAWGYLASHLTRPYLAWPYLAWSCLSWPYLVWPYLSRP